MFYIHSVYVPTVFELCPICVLSMFRQCFVCVLSLFHLCSVFVPSLFCQWYVYFLSMGKVKNSHIYLGELSKGLYYLLSQQFVSSMFASDANDFQFRNRSLEKETLLKSVKIWMKTNICITLAWKKISLFFFLLWMLQIFNQQIWDQAKHLSQFLKLWVKAAYLMLHSTIIIRQTWFLSASASASSPK